MSRVAVDVVLLPDEKTTNLAIRLNAELVRQYGRQIVLSEQDRRPHVSLAMGCLEPDRVEEVRSLLERIAADHPPGEIDITGIVTTLSGKTQRISSFVLAKTPELQSLHEDVTGRMQPCFTYDPTAETIYGDEPVAETTLTWIRTFREKSSFGAYFPHITLGYGPVHQPVTFPFRMKPKAIALFHLGNHCTCRGELARIDY
jgi:hypothetical protein